MGMQEKNAQARLLIPQTPWRALLAMRLACPARQGTENGRCTDNAAICECNIDLHVRAYARHLAKAH